MNPPSPRSRRGPLLVLVLAFVALLALPVLIAAVGVDEQRDAAGAAGTTTEVPTTGGATTSSDPAPTTTEPAPTTTEATVPETTTTTMDLDAVYAFAAKLDAATSTTTTAPPAPDPAPAPEPEYAPEPVVQYEPIPEPEPVYEAPAAPTYGGDPFAGLSASDRDFLACIRNRESGGDYTIVNPSSGAGGAYQFLIGTWNNTAANAGRGDLVGTSPQYASPYDQDLLAAHLLQWQGRAPWSYSCY